MKKKFISVYLPMPITSLPISVYLHHHYFKMIGNDCYFVNYNIEVECNINRPSAINCRGHSETVFNQTQVLVCLNKMFTMNSETWTDYEISFARLHKVCRCHRKCVCTFILAIHRVHLFETVLNWLVFAFSVLIIWRLRVSRKQSRRHCKQNALVLFMQYQFKNIHSTSI